MIPGFRVQETIALDDVDSTNTFALDVGRAGLLVHARSQRAGRGRRGRPWHSPAGASIYMSVTVPGADARYTIVAGVAVREALAEHVPAARIKWPNDILVGGRKVCGILCESRGGITALGIGINVNNTHWPPDLAASATSLAFATGRPADVAGIRAGVVARLEHYLDLFAREGFAPIRSAFSAHSYLQGQAAFTDDGTPCRIVDLGEDGALIIAIDGRTISYMSGEILLANNPTDYDK